MYDLEFLPSTHVFYYLSSKFFCGRPPSLDPPPPYVRTCLFSIDPLPPPCGRLLWMTPNEKVPMRLIQICIILYDL